MLISARQLCLGGVIAGRILNLPCQDILRVVYLNEPRETGYKTVFKNLCSWLCLDKRWADAEDSCC